MNISNALFFGLFLFSILDKVVYKPSGSMNLTAKSLNATMICTNASCLEENIILKTQFFSELFITVHVVVYMTVLLVGVFTNLLTCRLIILRRHLRASSDLYIFNLAVCDLFILCFYIPTQMIQIKDQLEWKMGFFMCKLVNAILPVTLSCTIGTLLAIAFDRARSMIKPFTWRTDSIEIAKILIPIIWLISLFLNVPLFLYPKIEIEENSSMTICAEGWKNRNDAERFWVFMFIFVYALPLLILILAHILFLIYIRKNSVMMYRRLNIKLIKMSISLLFVFGVCTGFQHFFFFITSSFSSIKLPINCLAVMFVEGNFLVSIQALINPFLYGNIRKFTREGKRQLRKISNVLILEPKPIRYVTKAYSCELVDMEAEDGQNARKINHWHFNRDGSFEIKGSQYLKPHDINAKKKKISFTITFEEDSCHHKTFLGVELKICEDLLKECVLERETYI